MKGWQELEVEYAEKLRASTLEQRRELYKEAYNAVSVRATLEMPNEIEKRTAGTSPALVNLLRRLCHSTDRVLEVGCGRGYTCLKLAPYVKSLVGIDVSEAAIDEARKLLETHRIGNTSILAGSADELTRCFGPHAFDKVISIDVYEHLAPEDGLAHLSEVYSVLKPKGRYIVVTPNRLTGPHDITRDLFPNARQPLGFHLNETTCTDLVGQMRKVGFTRFRSVLPLSFKLQIPFDIIYPSYFFVLIEKLFPRFIQKRLIGRFVLMLSGIILISEKKGGT